VWHRVQVYVEDGNLVLRTRIKQAYYGSKLYNCECGVGWRDRWMPWRRPRLHPYLHLRLVVGRVRSHVGMGGHGRQGGAAVRPV